MRELLLIFFAASLGTFVMAQDIPVTFQVDMSVQVAEGSFDPMTGLVVIRGDFQDEAGDPGGDWQGDFFALADADANEIYDLTVNFPPAQNDSSFEFKFVISPDGWEAADNRPFTVVSPGVTLPVFWFSNDSIPNVVPAVTNTIVFTADISGILGVGAGGAFDPAQDSLVLMGLDWDGLGQNVKGTRRLIQDPFNPGLFTATLSVTSGGGFTEGDSTKWKFKAFPDARFSNGGWETGTDRWHIYQADGATIDLPTIVPRVFPIFDTLANDINITFNVDMSDPVNQYNGENISPATLEFVGMRGGAGFLGDWSAGGNWTPDDTTAGVMKVLTDMGNNIWSRTVFIPGGTQGGGVFEYKFAMMYPGADTVNGGSSPLDNEGGFGVNHSFVLADGPDIVINNVFGTFVEPQDIPVTFQVDMSVQVAEGGFDPMTGLVVIRGDFQDEAGDPGGDWQGDFFALADADADEIYDLTVNFPPAQNDSSFEFKFVISPDGWEAADNRPFTVMSPGVTLPVFWFSNDSIPNVVPAVTNTINFTADISEILGVGAGGAFDPAQDSIQVMGLDWDGLGQNVKGNRTTIQDPFNPGIFTATLTVTSGGGFTEGDSTKWKFKGFPDARFSNGGWETGEDRWHIYQADGATIDLPTIVPRIFPLFDTLANDINVTFNVDLSNPINRYNGQQIDPATLQFVGMRGGAGFLGDWSAGGNWTPDDTTLGVMKVLTDMGNNIWSRTAFIPGGTQGGGVFEYKFAMMYLGADTVNGGSSPLDNEGGFGVNHGFVLIDGPDIVLNDIFGDFVVSVEKVEDLVPTKYELEQNYPNPFNPSTTIRYAIPQGGLVTLRVFNLLGEEVATLVNEELTSGVFEVNFNANAFASGIYFYTLNVGNFVATKKMILLK
jgi:Secretion system C-terminal sorting domain